MSNQNERGLYEKFRVERADGKSAPGEKHERCEYFCLDLNHDPHAIAALRAYIESCAGDYPELAVDLERRLRLLDVFRQPSMIQDREIRAKEERRK